MFDLYFWSVVAFFAGLVALIYVNRRRISFQYYVLAMYRTQRGKRFIESVASVSPRFWKIVSAIGVVAGFCIMAYAILTLVLSSQLVLSRTVKVPAMQFIIPLPQSTPVNGLGFIGVPFWFWILIVPFVLFPHEFAHGVVAAACKIRVKNVGLIQMLIWPGAFVEPDEAQLRRAKLLDKLRVFAAGSVANITISLVAILLVQYAIWPAIVPSGMVLTDVFSDMGAAAAGLKPGMTVQKIGNMSSNIGYGTYALSYGYLLVNGGNVTTEDVEGFSMLITTLTALDGYEPNQTITVVADGNPYSVMLSGRPENASIPYMGFSAELKPSAADGFMLDFFFPLLWWLTTLGPFVALFNMLPLYPFDGGLMLEAVAEKLSKKRAKMIVKAVGALIIALMVFNFVGPTLIQSMMPA
ncbi:MAG: site-2 protease family protein [Candidatus Aenigmarchaeota archaeon]|nr:site-2 protease family protein [Candidatus Aenigmarchaeota archaeon]